MSRILALLVAIPVFVAGCGSTQTEAPTPTITASAAIPSPEAVDDPCLLLTALDLNQVLGTQYDAGEKKTDDARQVVNCTYTITEDVAGTQLPVSITDVGLSKVDGQESFDTNRDLAPAYFGGDPKAIDVPGADTAYVVINEETQSPVLGMLVGEQFVLLQIGVEGATTEQAVSLAATAAARLG